MQQVLAMDQKTRIFHRHITRHLFHPLFLLLIAFPFLFPVRSHYNHPPCVVREGDDSRLKTRGGSRDVAPGLWIWRLVHPHWKPGQGWEPIVACTCVESSGQTLIPDPLVPANDAAVW